MGVIVPTGQYAPTGHLTWPFVPGGKVDVLPTYMLLPELAGIPGQ